MIDQIGTGKGATLYINTLVKFGEKWVFYPRLLTQTLSLKGRLNPEFLLSHLLHKAHPTEHSPRVAGRAAGHLVHEVTVSAPQAAGDTVHCLQR